MESVSRRIGLFAEYDANWIAGVLYVQTILRALGHVSEGPVERMDLLIKRNLDTEHYRPFLNALCGMHAYDFSRWEPIRRRRRAWKQRLLRGRFPVRLERLVRQLELDILLPSQTPLGRDFPVPWVGWIPDFQHKRLPKLFSENEAQQRDRLFQRLIDESSHLLVSSDDAYADLLQYYQVDPAHVSVYKFCTHADPDWFEGDPQGTAEAYGLPDKFLIYPSQYWEHKEHLTLFKAMHALKQSGVTDIHLVLTGRKTDFRDEGYPERLDAFVREQGLEDHIRHLGLLPRRDQVQLLRRACAVVQPSRFEGWSMLVEDCRALGQNVFLSDIAVHREQAYEKAVYFKTGYEESLATAVADLWPSLKPGPCLESESRARELNRLTSASNGQCLLRVVDQVIASKR